MTSLTDPSEALARFAAELEFAAIPETVVAAAKRACVDSFAVALAEKDDGVFGRSAVDGVVVGFLDASGVLEPSIQASRDDAGVGLFLPQRQTRQRSNDRVTGFKDLAPGVEQSATTKVAAQRLVSSDRAVRDGLWPERLSG